MKNIVFPIKRMVCVVGVLSVVWLTACSVCEHEWVGATCTKPTHCALCEVTEGEPTGHNWNEATCEKAKHCATCGQIDGEPLAHTVENWSVSTKATCFKAGVELGDCTVCGKKAQREIPKMDHVEGDLRVTTEATPFDFGEKSVACAVCGIGLRSVGYGLTADEVKAYCSDTYEYNDVARYPMDYWRKYAHFTGEVIQVMDSGSYWVLRVNVTYEGSGYYTDTVYVEYSKSEPGPRILENDIVTMYGRLTGTKTYTSILGAEITIPSFEAALIEIQ